MTAFLLACGADPERPGPDATPLHDTEIRGHWLAAELVNAWITRSPTRDADTMPA